MIKHLTSYTQNIYVLNLFSYHPNYEFSIDMIVRVPITASQTIVASRTQSQKKELASLESREFATKYQRGRKTSDGITGVKLAICTEPFSLIR